MAPKLILTGFMATGKTSVARLLARRLGWRLYDSDEEIVTRAGKPIAAIFSDEGEARFRELERSVIATLTSGHALCPQCKHPVPAVISTGGGALVDEHSFMALAGAGTIICLSARPEVIAQRVSRSRTVRPKLAEGGQPLPERIDELLRDRQAAYARADITIDTSDLTVEEAAEKVLDAFAKRRRPR